MNHFGELLKAARQQAGLSQAELAEKIGCRQKQISNWERGDFLPVFGTIVRIADALDKPLDYFARRNNNLKK